jgi:hypothetical protein
MMANAFNGSNQLPFSGSMSSSDCGSMGELSENNSTFWDVASTDSMRAALDTSTVRLESQTSNPNN